MPKMVKFLVENKSDLDDSQRKINFQDGINYSDKNKMEFFITSVKKNDGEIEKLFITLVNNLRKVYTNEELIHKD